MDNISEGELMYNDINEGQRMNNNIREGPDGGGVRIGPSPVQIYYHHDEKTRKAFFIIAAIFFTSLVAMSYIYKNFPKLEPDEMVHLKLPWDGEDAQNLGRVLDRYKDRYYFEVLSAVFATYIFLQTFAIPGSIGLSVLSGFLFSFPLALTLVCFCSATGASFCYIISYFIGRPVVMRYFSARVKKWSVQVDKRRNGLLYYLMFLRITPFLPNWFINITAPVIGVPLVTFWLGTFIGVAPPSFLAVQAGQTLYRLSASDGTWTWTSTLLITFSAFLSLVPLYFQKEIKEAVE